MTAMLDTAVTVLQTPAVVVEAVVQPMAAVDLEL
jgi:hypothetical protein